MPNRNGEKVTQWASGLERRIMKVRRSTRHGRISLSDFRQQFPKISEQVSRDANSNVWSIWSNSWNFDEYEKAIIVDRKLLSCLYRMIGKSAGRSNFYHSGLLHTYGYLLSTIETRFGKKSDRWIKGSIARLLDQKPIRLTPLTADGTMLQNLSESLLAIVTQFGFKNPAVQQKALVDFPFKSAWKIQESLQLESQKVEFHTLLLSPSIKNASDHLCVYWVNQNHVSKLVTCFPMTRGNVDEMVKQPTGTRQPIRPRFNAAVEHWPANQTMPGTRKVSKF